jgi:hypothetical protein
MGTLLLVGDESGTEVSAGAERPAARRRPSLTGALEGIGYHVVNAKNGAGVTIPDMELLEFCAAVRHDPAAEKTPFVLVAAAAGRAGQVASRTGADFVFPPTVGPFEIADRLRQLL